VKLRPSRLGWQDWLIAVSSVGLIVSLFALRWYQVPARFTDTLLELGEQVNANGWQTFTWIGPLCVIVAALGLAAFWFQLSRESPVLPTVTVIVLTPLAAILVLVLVVREFIDVPSLQLADGVSSSLRTCAGSYVGLGFAVLELVGAWRFLRTDSVDPAEGPPVIETFPLGS
jgi:hypothetical protein